MTDAAKDEAELVERVAKALHDEVYTEQSAWMDVSKFERSCREAEANTAIAAIRAAGWAVVPVALMEEAIEELSATASANSPVRASYPLMMRRYMRDMELPNAIRAAIEPEVRP